MIELTVWKAVVFGLLAVELGWLLAWALFDWQFYKPLRKLHAGALEGWRQSMEAQMELLAKVFGVEVPKVEKDGSMVSPIQIKKEE